MFLTLKSFSLHLFSNRFLFPLLLGALWICFLTSCISVSCLALHTSRYWCSQWGASGAEEWSSAAFFTNYSAVINGKEEIKRNIDWKTEQMTKQKPNTSLVFTLCYIELQLSQAKIVKEQELKLRTHQAYLCSHKI